MKELQQLIQKLEIEALNTQEKLLITKRIIQLSEEENKETRTSVYNSLLMLVNNQIELEKLIKETFEEFEKSLNRSHNEIMKNINEMKEDTKTHMNDLKKTLQNLDKTVNPLKQNYEENIVFNKRIKLYKDITLGISALFLSIGVIISAVRYIILN